MDRTDSAVDKLLPLTPVVFHVLLVLADGPAHGYRIMKEVERASEGRVGLGPGTLYGALERMVNAGVIEETAPPEGEGDERRRYYQLTQTGKTALLAETSRLSSLVMTVRGKGLCPEGEVG